MGLIETSGVAVNRVLWSVVALVNERASLVFDAVCVGRTESNRHEDDCVRAPREEVHASLEASAFSLAHIQI